MANLIIKPTTGGSLILQDEGGDAAATVGTSGVITFAGRDVHSGGITIADAGNIGSASDPDAIAIAANGNVTVSQNLAVSGTLTITGSQSRLVGISWCHANCDGNVVTLENSKTYDALAISVGSAGPDVLYSILVVDGSGNVTQTTKVTGSGFYYTIQTNGVYVNESVANQGPHWSLIFERGATFDSS